MRLRAKTTEKTLRETLALFDKAATKDAESAQAQTLAYLELHTREIVPERAWESDDVRSAQRPQWLAVVIVATVALAVFIPLIFFHRTPAVFQDAEGSRRIQFGEVVRAKDSTSTLVLADSSRVEMRAKSELSLERADDGVRIRLWNGDIIVNAAKQHGHLYVQTKDVTVSVVGTVFLVMAEAEGSRVAVIEGEVRLANGAIERKLHPGEQVATNPLLTAQLVSEELSWSRNAETHLAMLRQNQVAPIQAQEILRPADTPKWEVVSIRPCAGGEPGARGGGTSGTTPGGSVGIYPGLLRVTCMQLRFLIEDAYVKYLEPEVMRRRWVFPVTGGPSWLDTALYTIEAKPEGLPSRQIMGGPMLQALLEDRFKLKIRREIREEPVYELRVADDGFKLKPLNDGECDAKRPDPEKTTSDIERMFALNYVRCGRVGIGAPADGSPAPPGSRTVNLFGMTLTDLTMYIRQDRLILDKTGIPGLFDIQLTYAPDPSPTTESIAIPPDPPGGDPIFTAIQKQLGLKLVPTRGPRTYYFVEHVERPSEN